MKRKLILLCLCFLIIEANTHAQLKTDLLKDTVQVKQLLDQSTQVINSDADRSLLLAGKAKQLAESIGFPKGAALAYKNMGMVYYFQTKYVQTLQYWNESLRILQQIGDEVGEATLLSNIGAVYANQGDDVNALNYNLKSLKIGEKIGNKVRTFMALNNIGGIYFEKKATWDKALEYLLRAYPLALETKNTDRASVILGNIGEIYFQMGDYSKASLYYNKALQSGSQENAAFAYNGLAKVALRKGNTAQAQNYNRKALALAQKLNEIHIVPSLMGIAATYTEQDDFKSALEYYKQAEKVALQQKSFPGLRELYDSMARAYASIHDFSNAFRYQQELATVKDTLFNETTQKKLGVIQFEFDLEKKQGEINLLTKDNALRDQQLKQQRFVKNAFAVGLGMVFIILFIIYRGYRSKVRINKILDTQKEEIETLLLNILPSEVAKELQMTGKATPRSYEHVSVLFTDFKGFTTIADKMSPEDLVHELNACFMAFDEIIEKHNLEKIKTIGDSYMCAGGIPTPDKDHPLRMVKASLEIQQYIFNNNQRRKAEGLETWDVRIGIHVGPVVAGVVGKKKYAYDVWGSSVNVASRMESSGIPGQVNISAATYEIIKDHFACIYRGKIYAKNVGDIDMYLVDHELDAFQLGEVEQQVQKPAATSIIPG